MVDKLKSLVEILSIVIGGIIVVVIVATGFMIMSKLAFLVALGIEILLGTSVALISLFMMNYALFIIAIMALWKLIDTALSIGRFITAMIFNFKDFLKIISQAFTVSKLWIADKWNSFMNLFRSKKIYNAKFV